MGGWGGKGGSTVGASSPKVGRLGGLPLYRDACTTSLPALPASCLPAAGGTNAHIWAAWAYLAAKLGNVSLARRLYDAAIVANPLHAAAWHGWGLLEKEQGNFLRCVLCCLHACRGCRGCQSCCCCCCYCCCCLALCGCRHLSFWARLKPNLLPLAPPPTPPTPPTTLSSSPLVQRPGPVAAGHPSAAQVAQPLPLPVPGGAGC